MNCKLFKYIISLISELISHFWSCNFEIKILGLRNPKPNRSFEEDFVFVSFLKGLLIRPKGRAPSMDQPRPNKNKRVPIL